MAFPPGSKPGMSSCAPPYQSTHLSPQTSSHTRSRFASLAGSLKHQPGLRTTQPFAIWLLRMSPCHGVKWMSSSIMIFWRKRPCPTVSIATPMVIAPWVVPLDQSLSSLFVPSHLPQPLPHRHLWHSLQQSPPIPQRAPPASSHLSRLQPLGLPPPQLSLQAYLQQTRLQWKPPWLLVPKSTPIVTPSIPFSPPPPFYTCQSCQPLNWTQAPSQPTVCYKPSTRPPMGLSCWLYQPLLCSHNTKLNLSPPTSWHRFSCPS